jgi:phosphatidylglycerophosphate synthase
MLARALLHSTSMWLANALTLSRIPLAAAFCATYGRIGWSLAIIAVAAVTDALDGTFARRAHARGKHGTAGEWLDPLADKIFVAAALVTVVVHVPSALPLVLVTCARELVLGPLIVWYRIVRSTRPVVPHVFRADALGKATTIAQIVTVVALVAQSSLAMPLALTTGALGLAAVAHYIVRVTRVTRAPAIRTGS